MTPEFYNTLQRIRSGVKGDCEVSVSTFGPEELEISWLVDGDLIRYRYHIPDHKLRTKMTTEQLTELVTNKANMAVNKNTTGGEGKLLETIARLTAARQALKELPESVCSHIELNNEIDIAALEYELEDLARYIEEYIKWSEEQGE